MQEYFQASATVYAAIHDCLARGLKLDRLNECFQVSGMPLAAPELLRLLMDDCGMRLEEAYRITAACCDDLSCTGIQPQYIKAYQPRTAHVVSILRRTVERTPALIHDTRLPSTAAATARCASAGICAWPSAAAAGRSPARSLCSGAMISSTAGPWSRTATCIMQTSSWTTQPMALWYAFYVETESSAHWLCPDETGYLGRILPRREGGFRLTVYDPGL